MKRIYIYICLLVALCIAGCRPRGVLSSREMREVLHDLHRADAILQVAGYNYGNDEALAKYYQQVLDKHGITQAQFDSSLVWYTDHPQRFDKIYPRVVAALEAENEQWLAAHGETAMSKRSAETEAADTMHLAAEREQAMRRMEEAFWHMGHGLRVRYLMGQEMDTPADTLPLLGPLGIETAANDSIETAERPENEEKVQKNSKDSCVIQKKVVPLHGFSGLRPKDN